MIIAGPCLFSDLNEQYKILDCARELPKEVLYFRCKLWGGGTSVDRYFPGVGIKGLPLLQHIHNNLMPVMVEVQDAYQAGVIITAGLIPWIGARNCQNYALLESVLDGNNRALIKRGPAMTVAELYKMDQLIQGRYDKKVHFIDRGVVGIDRTEESRWSIVLTDLLRIKHDYPDLFSRIVIDCSHSAGRKEFVDDIYKAMKAIGCENFMFECTIDGISKTDQRQMLSVDELKSILEVK